MPQRQLLETSVSTRRPSAGQYAVTGVRMAGDRVPVVSSISSNIREEANRVVFGICLSTPDDKALTMITAATPEGGQTNSDVAPFADGTFLI